MSKPTILFVPGAWHHPASFHLVTSSLKDLGYPIAAVDHPSNNESDKGLVDDIANVRSTLDHLIKTKKKAVVLVLHSYGGMAGGAGMHGYEQKERERNDEDGGIVAVLYIAALAGPKCTNLLEASGGKFAPWINIDGPTCTVTDPHKVFYSDMSLEAAQPYIDQLTPICLQAFEQGCPADCYSDSVPSTYLIATKDKCLPSFAQETMAKNIGERCMVERCDTGHSPFLSQPELVTRLVRRVAGESA